MTGVQTCALPISYVTIHFEKGIPTAVDGKEMDGVALIEYLGLRFAIKLHPPLLLLHLHLFCPSEEGMTLISPQ